MATSAGPAHAANMVYWANVFGSKGISEANLDGSGSGSDLNTTGATVSQPDGIAIDPAANKIFWANFAGGSSAGISEANLDGSGEGHNVNTTGATVLSPAGVAIDPATNRIYWANANEFGPNGISEANLDGSGDAHNLNTSPVTPDHPEGVAIDPATNKIYWANTGSFTISEANLDGSGSGANLNTTGATVEAPVGVAIDPAANKIYWANDNGNKISEANLDGSGNGHDLNTTGATVDHPAGVAIDPAANKIYWANGTGSKISEANLDGSGNGHDLGTAGATANDPGYPALLEAPTPTGTPTISGAGPVGSTLACTGGAWAADELGGFLFQAPRLFGSAWQLSGTTIAGTSALAPLLSTTLTAFQPGSYSCAVTATNQAGTSSATSTQAQVSTLPVPPPAAPVAPVISSASQLHAVWRGGNKLAQISRRRKKQPPVGTTFSFSLNEQATVGFSFTERVSGRKVGHKCVAKTRKNHKPRACRRTVVAGTLAFTGHGGTNKVVFQGRVSRAKRLQPGSYTLVITATNAAGQHSSPARLIFTIVK